MHDGPEHRTCQAQFLHIIPNHFQPGLPWPPSWPIHAHYLTQSSLSFLSTKLNHLNLFLFRTLPIGSMPILSLISTSFLLSQRGTTHPPNHSHLCPLQHRFMPLLHWPCLTSIHHAALDTAPSTYPFSLSDDSLKVNSLYVPKLSPPVITLVFPTLTLRPFVFILQFLL